MNDKVISAGNVAVITGAKGIGAAAARAGTKGHETVSFDRNSQAPEQLAGELEAETL
jgi:short-subunit dehydrogenase